MYSVCRDYNSVQLLSHRPNCLHSSFSTQNYPKSKKDRLTKSNIFILCNFYLGIEIYKIYKMSSVSHIETNSQRTIQIRSITCKYLLCLYDKHWVIGRVHVEQVLVISGTMLVVDTIRQQEMCQNYLKIPTTYYPVHSTLWHDRTPTCCRQDSTFFFTSNSSVWPSCLYSHQYNRHQANKVHTETKKKNKGSTKLDMHGVSPSAQMWR